jgi:ADP-ribose pyrophosphatase YjhB (NUDIX family)
VGAVIFENNQILLIERLRPPEAGCWAIQVGAVEFGETIQDAIKREVQEELGVTSEIVTLLGVTDHILPDEGVHWVAPVFLVAVTQGIPRNIETHKHRDLHWFSLEDLPKNITLTTRLAVEFLRNYLASQS